MRKSKLKASQQDILGTKLKQLRLELVATAFQVSKSATKENLSKMKKLNKLFVKMRIQYIELHNLNQ